MRRQRGLHEDKVGIESGLKIAIRARVRCTRPMREGQGDDDGQWVP